MLRTSLPPKAHNSTPGARPQPPSPASNTLQAPCCRRIELQCAHDSPFDEATEDFSKSDRTQPPEKMAKFDGGSLRAPPLPPRLEDSELLTWKRLSMSVVGLSIASV
jgi:hypothetical protein